MRAQTPPPSRPHVLVVDDDELMRRALERLLGGRAEVVVADGPERARELLGAGRVDVVVSDHAMLGETGLSFLAEVAAERPDVALVLFSASPPPEAEPALERGALDAVFRKPGDLAALVDFVLRPGLTPVATRRPPPRG
jgi:DNA-binding NtrC family response regulator